MTIFEKYNDLSKGKLQMLVGRVSALYDAGYSEEEIKETLGLTDELAKDLIEIKKQAVRNKN